MLKPGLTGPWPTDSEFLLLFVSLFLLFFGILKSAEVLKPHDVVSDDYVAIKLVII